METLKKYTTALYAVIALLLIASSTGFGQTNRNIGAFDIEKVRKAVSGSAGTAEKDSATSLPIRKSDGMGWVTVRIVLYLTIIAGAIVGVLWVMKRLGLAGRSKIGGGSMDVMEALPIGQHKSILMVRVRDVVYVLAQTQQQIALLDKVEGDRALELISSSKGAVSISQFKDVFNGFMEKIKKPL
jgi:flagellar biosynthetic protein FliO